MLEVLWAFTGYKQRDQVTFNPDFRHATGTAVGGRSQEFDTLAM